MRPVENELYIEKFNNINSKLGDHEQRISASEDKIVEMDKTVAVSINGINTSLKSLSDLPSLVSAVSDVMTKMGTTMELMQVELRRNTEAVANLEKDTALKFSEMQKDIRRVDEEGKFNLRIWFRDNWLKLIIGGGAITAVAKFLSTY